MGAPPLRVEEEFALLDPATGAVAPLAGTVIRGCHDSDGVVAEAMTFMVERRTPVDSGWAAKRHAFTTRWPTATPAPDVDSAPAYDDAVRRAVAAGEALDSRAVYFVARLSPRHPTVEVRVADACLDLDVSVAYAGLVRALVARALDEAAAGLPVRPVAQDALLAACAPQRAAGSPAACSTSPPGARSRPGSWWTRLSATHGPTSTRTATPTGSGPWWAGCAAREAERSGSAGCSRPTRGPAASSPHWPRRRPRADTGASGTR